MNKPFNQSLRKTLGITNIHAVPAVEKIVISVGIGNIDKNQIGQIIHDISMITGQKPVLTRAKKSIAGFKIRAGETVGLALNLRGKRMYNFMNKLIQVALPAMRDFRGISERSFDAQGNVSIGIVDYMVFPEISYQHNQLSHGLQITIRINAASREDAIALMKAHGLPLKGQ